VFAARAFDAKKGFGGQLRLFLALVRVQSGEMPTPAEERTIAERRFAAVTDRGRLREREKSLCSHFPFRFVPLRNIERLLAEKLLLGAYRRLCVDDRRQTQA